LWHQALDNYHDPEAFRANLNAAIEALRNVTFVLQSEKNCFSDFDSWYSPWQARLKSDEAAKWLHTARTTVVHQGELESHSKAEVRLLTWRDEVISNLTVPPEMPSSLIVKNLPLLQLAAPLVTPAELADGVLAVERRWSTTGLGETEILQVLASVYGLLSDMVLDAHIRLGHLECVHDGGHPDFRSKHHRTGTIDCMVCGPDRRTQTFKIATGDQIGYEQVSVPMGGELGAVRRYGLDENPKLTPWTKLDPAQFAKRVLHSAKRILRRDHAHARMMFIRDGHGDWHLFPLGAADKAEQHLLMRIMARFVETKGCDAIVDVGETWTTLVASRTDRTGESIGGPDQLTRGEALSVTVATREGFVQTYITPFKRGPFGGIKLDDTIEMDRLDLLYLQPIFAVWRKQGYDLCGDGKVRRRIWEPDPLDPCFCGGTKRFAECCRPRILDPVEASIKTEQAMEASDFARAEELARAAVAQYVIWIKQHTVGMMNVASDAYKMFVDVDVLALEDCVRSLGRALEANGRGEDYVPLLHRLGTIVGAPRLGMRLVAIASRWFMSLGRTEEAILELDRIGDLEQVDDTLALLTAAEIYDSSERDTERLLHRAISCAASDDEKWAAQLEMADHQLWSGHKEEAIQLVDSVMNEAGPRRNRAEVVLEASVLRWRVTGTESDLRIALDSMGDADDARRRRYAGILIDASKYAEAEELLSPLVGAGDVASKLLVSDARVRGGDPSAARQLLLSLQHEQISDRLRHAYAVACSIVALATSDAVIRQMAVEAIQGLPQFQREGEKKLHDMMQALDKIGPPA
jgi:hypothetical protein